MTLATWLAILLLGPGALALFVWFLRDLRTLVAAMEEPEDAPPSRGEQGDAPGP